MMTEIRHNFIKNNSLTAQLIEYLNDHIGEGLNNPQLIIEKRKWTSKAWHSSTYEGRVQNFILRVLSNDVSHPVQQNIEHIALNTALERHEFNLRKSFVAAIEIKSIEQNSSYSDIEIEAIIIFEE